MRPLVRLTVRVLELATLPTRYAVKAMVHLVWGDGSEHPVVGPPAAPRPPVVTQGPPAQTEARVAEPRSTAAASAQPRPSAKQARRAARGEPTRGQAAAMRERQRETEQAAGGPGPGPEVTVEAPWEGYDEMTVGQVVGRLAGADAAVLGAVRLYEGLGRSRRTIMRATEKTGAR